MTIVIPAGIKNSDLAAKAAQITSLSAVPSTAPYYQQSQQLLRQVQVETVHSLIDRNAIAGGAAAVLSSVSYASGPSRPAAAILAQITALQAQITANTVSNPQLATNQAVTLDQLQRQAVVELTASGQMDPAKVLSTLTFTGGN